MSPSPIHYKLVDAVSVQLQSNEGVQITREFPTGRFGYEGFIDLLVDAPAPQPIRIAIEAERTPDRIANDLLKAYAIRADWLLIVTPTAPVARACNRKIDRLKINPSAPLKNALDHFQKRGNETSLFAQALGPTLTRLRNRFLARNTCSDPAADTRNTGSEKTPRPPSVGRPPAPAKTVRPDGIQNPNHRANPPPEWPARSLLFPFPFLIRSSP